MQKKNLTDWANWNRKMGGRSFRITSGAFGGTLHISWQYYDTGTGLKESKNFTQSINVWNEFCVS